MPAARTRPSFSDRRSAVAVLLRLGNGGRPLPEHVAAVAERHGVTRRAVEKWLNDPRLTGAEAKPPRSRSFELTLDHLTVVAQEQNLKDAHARLAAAGLVDCSYATFARAARHRTDPALLAAAFDGHKGLVNNRLYLRHDSPHRNHTWHFDHTRLDVWVWPSHRVREPVRPWVTAVLDDRTGYLLEVSPWPSSVNTERVAASLASAATMREDGDTVVGGLPEILVFDNAGEHGEPIRQGCARFGITPMPTAPYSPWQNGKAERALGLLNQRLAAKLPGATRRAGALQNGSPRFSQAIPGDTGPDDVLSWDAFTVLLEAARVDINTRLSVGRLGGLTRRQAWAADPTALVAADRDVVLQAMLVADRMRTVNGDGVHFAGRIYVSGELVTRRGQWLQVRHLPSAPGFIELFDEHGEHVCTAYAQNALTAPQRAAFMSARAEQQREARALEAGTRAHRSHLAAAANSLYGHENTDFTISDALDNTRTHRTDGTDAPAVHADAPGAPDPLVAAATRPALPRVPARKPDHGAADQADPANGTSTGSCDGGTT